MNDKFLAEIKSVSAGISRWFDKHQGIREESLHLYDMAAKCDDEEFELAGELMTSADILVFNAMDAENWLGEKHYLSDVFVCALIEALYPED